ncbi:MAG: class I SAM-dependent methyltransferase [Mycobacteriales bacterium]|nr:MAG: SAM-dependent methyltransferase [Pseudonocardiales bacterium]
MVDATAEQLAEWYDVLNPWGASDDFYLALVTAATAVLDVGCGTGGLLRRARESGHPGQLCGVDPDRAMLDRARAGSGVDCILGDAASMRFDREFDLVVMTGHAFQELVDDDDLRASLEAIRSALTDDGRFAFETRNPLVRVWEQWTPENATEVTGADGVAMRVAHRVQTPVTGDVVSLSETFSGPMWDRPQVSRGRLRFLSVNALAGFLTEAGLAIEAQCGDWDRGPLTEQSHEIITIATRTRARPPAR